MRCHFCIGISAIRFSLIARLFFSAKIGDFHCGIRGFNRDRILKLDLHTTGMEFASEMLVRAALANYRIAEIPTILRKDGRSRRSHLRTWRDGWRHLRFLLMLSPRWLFIYPGACLVAMGLVVATILLSGPIHLADDVGLDLHTFFIGCFAVLIGVQSISFGLLARRFATRYGFLPESRRFGRLLESFTLERGLIVAGLVVAAGLSGLIWSLTVWASKSFGLLAYPGVMRTVVLSLTAIAIGIQLAFTAILSGILDIPMAIGQVRNSDDPRR